MHNSATFPAGGLHRLRCDSHRIFLRSIGAQDAPHAGWHSLPGPGVRAMHFAAAAVPGGTHPGAALSVHNGRPVRGVLYSISI